MKGSTTYVECLYLYQPLKKRGQRRAQQERKGDTALKRERDQQRGMKNTIRGGKDTKRKRATGRVSAKDNPQKNFVM